MATKPIYEEVGKPQVRPSGGGYVQGIKRPPGIPSYTPPPATGAKALMQAFGVIGEYSDKWYREEKAKELEQAEQDAHKALVEKNFSPNYKFRDSQEAFDRVSGDLYAQKMQSELIRYAGEYSNHLVGNRQWNLKDGRDEKQMFADQGKQFNTWWDSYIGSESGQRTPEQEIHHQKLVDAGLLPEKSVFEYNPDLPQRSSAWHEGFRARANNYRNKAFADLTQKQADAYQSAVTSKFVEMVDSISQGFPKGQLYFDVKNIEQFKTWRKQFGIDREATNDILVDYIINKAVTEADPGWLDVLDKNQRNGYRFSLDSKLFNKINTGKEAVRKAIIAKENSLEQEREKALKKSRENAGAFLGSVLEGGIIPVKNEQGDLLFQDPDGNVMQEKDLITYFGSAYQRMKHLFNKHYNEDMNVYAIAIERDPIFKTLMGWDRAKIEPYFKDIDTSNEQEKAHDDSVLLQSDILGLTGNPRTDVAYIQNWITTYKSKYKDQTKFQTRLSSLRATAKELATIKKGIKTEDLNLMEGKFQNAIIEKLNKFGVDKISNLSKLEITDLLDTTKKADKLLNRDLTTLLFNGRKIQQWFNTRKDGELKRLKLDKSFQEKEADLKVKNKMFKMMVNDPKKDWADDINKLNINAPLKTSLLTTLSIIRNDNYGETKRKLLEKQAETFDKAWIWAQKQIHAHKKRNIDFYGYFADRKIGVGEGGEIRPDQIDKLQQSAEDAIKFAKTMGGFDRANEVMTFIEMGFEGYKTLSEAQLSILNDPDITVDERQPLYKLARELLDPKIENWYKKNLARLKSALAPTQSLLSSFNQEDWKKAGADAVYFFKEEFHKWHNDNRNVDLNSDEAKGALEDMYQKAYANFELWKSKTPTNTNNTAGKDNTNPNQPSTIKDVMDLINKNKGKN